MKAPVARRGRRGLFAWIRSPTDQPLDLLWTVVTLLVAVNVLIMLVPLRDLGRFPTGAYTTDTHLIGFPFLIQLGMVAAGVVLHQVVPARFTKPLLIAQGLGCLVAYGVSFAAGSLALLAAWYFGLRLPIPKRARWLLSVFLLVATGLCGGLQFVKGAVVFSLLFTMRLMMYAWDQHQNDYPRRSALDFFTYMLLPPLVFIYPYMLFIPMPAIVNEIRPRLTERRARRVLAHFGLALVMVVALLAAERYWHTQSRIAQVYALYLFRMMEIGRLAHVVFALLILHGIEDRVPINAPLLATDFVEMWQRYQIHQKDAQVALFYTPALLALRRRNRYVATTLAVLWTMFFGNFVIHVLARYMYTPSRWLPLVGNRAIFFGLGGIVLAATLCIHEWRRRKRKPVLKTPLGRVYMVLCWAATQSFTAALMALP